MAERTTQKYARPHNNPSEKPFSSTVRANSAETFNDEFIFALSQSYENRRAAQAYEWEMIRRGGGRHTHSLES